MSNEKISLESLTPEQRKELMLELETQQKEQEKQKQQQRAAYKDMVAEAVNDCLPELKQASYNLKVAKKKVMDTFTTLIKMKAELYDKEENQTSHSFTNKDGSTTIIIGHNMLDDYDDTVNTGIAKTIEALENWGKDKKSKQAIAGMMKLLSKDSKGNLKPSRVLQLRQWADKIDNTEIIEGIQIILDAHKLVKSKQFVRCLTTNTEGGKEALALSITDASYEDTKSAVLNVPEQNNQ